MTVLKAEGLGRYIGQLIKGFSKAGNDVTVICPKWSKNDIKSLLEDLEVDGENLNLITTKRIPFFLYLYEKLSNSKKKKRRSLKAIIKNFVQIEIIKAIKIDSLRKMMLFIVEVLLTIILCVLALPFWGIFLILFLLKKFVKKVFRACFPVIKSIVETLRIYKILQEQTGNELVDIANGLQDIDIWYVPSLFWPEVNKIKKTTIINIPDIETEIFSEQFAGSLAGEATRELRETAFYGKYFVSYCDYVRNELVENQLRGQEKVAFTIKHINNDMAPYITISDFVAKQMNTNIDLTHKFAESIINSMFFRENVPVSISSMRYIFYASQFRANKNVLALLKALNELVHKRFIRINLILTGNISLDKTLREYIEDNNLSNVVYFCNGVTSQQLAALYECAELVVNPTLYEGGFPFTFGEGMSVGTPSIMSDIPQVRDVFEPAGLEKFLFDPYDYHAIANKIEWALKNIEYLKEEELPLYRKLAERTPEVVANEYIKVFREVIDMDNMRRDVV